MWELEIVDNYKVIVFFRFRRVIGYMNLIIYDIIFKICEILIKSKFY